MFHIFTPQHLNYNYFKDLRLFQGFYWFTREIHFHLKVSGG